MLVVVMQGPIYRSHFSAKRIGIATKCTEDCKLVVTCNMQNRNATDKLNPQCSKLALLIVLANNAILLHCGYSLSVAFLFCILQVTTNLQSSVHKYNILYVKWHLAVKWLLYIDHDNQHEIHSTSCPFQII